MIQANFTDLMINNENSEVIQTAVRSREFIILLRFSVFLT
jgi:hypothetical protein